MEQISKRLETTYMTEADTNVKVSLDDPVDNIDAESVSAAMEEIVGLDVLQDSKGHQVIAGKGAQLITITAKTLF